MTRGIRNNNPGNLKRAGIQWKGLDFPKADEGGYAMFVAPRWGIRALAMDLLKDYSKDGQTTLVDLIREYAPAEDNNPTPAYVRFLSNRLGVGATEDLQLDDFDRMFELIRGIIEFENGEQPYDRKTIRKGMVLAGMEAPKKELEESRTMKSGAIAAGASGAAAVVQQTQPAMPLLSKLAGAAPWVIVAILGLGMAYMLYCRWDDHDEGHR